MIKPYVHPSEIGNQDSDTLKEQFRLYLTDLFDSNLGQGLLPIRDAWPQSLKKYLAAAIVSNNLGIGLDYAYRKYTKNFSYNEKNELRLDERVEGIFATSIAKMGELYSFEKKDAPEQDFFGYFALRRSLFSLEAGHTLAQQGYLSEAMVTNRLALETFAWAYCASKSSKNEDPLKLTTSNAISYASKSFPEIKRLYGISSKFAHWHPDVHLSFLGDENGLSTVIERSVGHKICSLLFTIGLLRAALIFFDDHMHRFYPEHERDGLALLADQICSIGGEIIDAARGGSRSLRLAEDIWKAWAPSPT